MKISRIGIQNFRQHRNIDLDLSGERGNFTVIRGLNGAGKTNLLKAITWCVTGDLGRSEPRHSPTSLVSHGAIQDTPVGESVILTVELELDFGQEERAEVSRSLTFSRAEGGLVLGPASLKINRHEAGRGWQKEPEPDLWLDRQLPRRFSHYFLFDGEQLEKFFKETEASYVKGAVLEIAQIDNLERMVDRLQQTVGDLTKAVASQRQGASGATLESTYKELEAREEKLKEDVSKKRIEKAENEDAIDKAKARLGDVAAIQSELKRLQSLEIAANSAHERAAHASNDFYAWTTSVAPYMMMFKAVETLEDEIEAARVRKELPPAYDPDSLKELLKEEVCVCGAKIGKGSEGHSHIQKLVEDFSALSEIGEALRNAEGPLSRLRGRFFDQRDKAESLGKTRADSAKEAAEADAKFNNLKKQLAGHDDQQIALIGQAFEKALEGAKSIERDLSKIERELEETKVARVKLQSEIEAAGAKDAKAKTKLHELGFAKEVFARSQSLFDDLKNQVRQDVATNLDREFQQMIWKKEAFEPVEIDEDYRVKVINKLGVENREGLSAGETACLAFAFALTLSRVAGVRYPMVVDSPLGRLSGEVKKSVAEVLSNFLVSEDEQESAQLIMLVTDEEYDESVSSALADQRPLLFDISFDQQSGEATLEELRNG
jgi:DNA sulfur modification protein DndD